MNHAHELLQSFFTSKVLSALDYRFALALARISPEPPSDPVILGAAAASAALTRGDICLELSRAHELLVPVDEDAPLGASLEWPEPDAWRSALEASPLVSNGEHRTPLVLDGERLYLHRYYDYQRRLARALRERREVTFEVDLDRLDAVLDDLFAGDFRDPAQREAARTAVRRGLTIISGGPGTGKTSTVVRILGALLAGGATLRAILVAPTGKAAARLSESIREQRHQLDPALAERIPEAASTIHRALGFQPGSPTRFAHDRDHPLAADVVVLDEASMVDLAMMTKLVEAVPPEARLILLGDKDQLASVAAGHVLGDIAEAAEPSRPLAPCFALLTRSHRYSDDSGIGVLARAIKSGDETAVVDCLASGHPDLAWEDNSDSDAVARLRALAVAGWSPLLSRLERPEAALDALSSFQLLCAHRRGRWGAERLAEEVRLWLAESGEIPASEEWYPGRPVIVLVNDHAQELYNGDTGVVLRDSDQHLRVHFPRSPGSDGVRFRALSIAQLPSYAPYYATTIHKAQGSGFDHVAAVLPPEPSPVITRELLYTAVTRARKRVTLVGSEAVIRHAVRTRVQRASGLAEALMGV